MRYLGIVATIAVCLAVAGTVRANTVVFNQTFETDTAGIVDYPGPVTRVASGGGTLGVVTASGAYHAEAALTGTYGNGFFTRNGGYSSVWPGYIKQSISVYFDPAAGTTGDGWFWDPAITSKATGVWGRGGGFGVQKTATGTWSLLADDDWGGYGLKSFIHSNNTPLNITTAGWYTLETEWVESTASPPYIDQVNSVLSQSGGLLWTDRVNGVMSKEVGVDIEAGGIRYSWLGSQTGNTMGLLAVDNVYAEIGPPAQQTTIPEPVTMAGLMLGIGSLVTYVRKRRKA